MDDKVKNDFHRRISEASTPDQLEQVMNEFHALEAEEQLLQRANEIIASRAAAGSGSGDDDE